VYASYTFFLSHYAVAIVPAVICNLLAVGVVLRRTWPADATQPIGWAITAATLALALTALPEVNPARRDQWFDAPLLRQVDKDLAGIKGPAIVLFRFDPERMVHEEPVYNTEAAWPDDARVIRAHDLGGENALLFAYYAKRSPTRAVYWYDEKDEKLNYMGTVAELAGAAGGR
jgi:hypothetical protein